MSRFSVTYRIFAADLAEARNRAEAVALEQTVEVPRDVVPEGYIADEIVGQVEDLGQEAEGRFRATISYSPDSAGFEFSQFVNVIFGNSSIQKGLKVLEIEPGQTMTARHPGARFGAAGIRALCGRAQGGMIAPVLKPQGLDADALALIAERCTLGGADIIKEDHGITDQPCAPFRERVEKVCVAVAKANERRDDGRRSLYFPSLAGQAQDLEANLQFAKQAGVDGLLIMPGLLGFGWVARIAQDPDLRLPIMTHPAFLGPYVLSEDTGLTHGVMFGTLQRLAGADISVFPNVGGRFGFSSGECQHIARSCLDPQGPGKAMLPSPGGGMSIERAADMVSMYGSDVVYLLGGSLLRYGAQIAEGVQAMRAAITSAEQA